MEKRIFGISLSVLDIIEMNEDEVRTELNIVDKEYILTEEDWKEAIYSKVQSLIADDYFVIENHASVNDVEITHI